MPTVFGGVRERRVMFRVSEEEYDRLKRICLATELRSLSELVRQAVYYWLEGGVPKSDEELRQQVLQLEQRVDSLRSQVEKLAPKS